MTYFIFKLYNHTMTREEFEQLTAKANLSSEASIELYDIVNQALCNLETLKQFDGETNER